MNGKMQERVVEAAWKLLQKALTYSGAARTFKASYSRLIKSTSLVRILLHAMSTHKPEPKQRERVGWRSILHTQLGYNHSRSMQRLKGRTSPTAIRASHFCDLSEKIKHSLPARSVSEVDDDHVEHSRAGGASGFEGLARSGKQRSLMFCDLCGRQASK